MNRSFKALFEALESAGREAAKKERDESPAEKVGRALLDRLGKSTGLSEAELADAIIAVWSDPESGKVSYAGQEPDIAPEDATEDEPAPVFADERRGNVQPFGEHGRMPKPIRSGAAAAAHIDYDELTEEQFRRLKKQLKKAAADGKKVRL